MYNKYRKGNQMTNKGEKTMTNNQSVKQIDFLKMLQLREKQSEKLKQMRNEYKNVLDEIEEKHREILAEYGKKAKKVRAIVDTFNSEWEPKLFDYHKEVAELKKRSRKELKQLKQQFKQEEEQLTINDSDLPKVEIDD